MIGRVDKEKVRGDVNREKKAIMLYVSQKEIDTDLVFVILFDGFSP